MSTNHRYKKPNEKGCDMCKHFTSWRDFMNDDDPLEPSDSGCCNKEENKKLEGGFIENLCVDSSEVCDLFE